ncbi:transposase [Streptomyces sp. 900105755]
MSSSPVRLLERLAGWLASVPVIVADFGYGRSVACRLVLEEHGWSYAMAVEPKEIARAAGAVPYLPPYQGLGPPTSAAVDGPVGQ